MQRKYVDYYLIHNGNKTKAARLAGYAHPNVKGAQLYKIPKIRAAIDEVMFELTMSRNEVLYRLTEHARVSIEPFMEFETAVKTDEETGEEEEVYTGAFWVDLFQAKEAGVLHLAKEVKQDKKVYTYDDGSSETSYRTMVKLVDSQSALNQLGRYYGLFTDNVKQFGDEDHPIRHKFDLSDLTIEALAALVLRDGPEGGA